jgi:hypothetical protein
LTDVVLKRTLVHQLLFWMLLLASNLLWRPILKLKRCLQSCLRNLRPPNGPFAVVCDSCDQERSASRLDICVLPERLKNVVAVSSGFPLHSCLCVDLVLLWLNSRRGPTPHCWGFDIALRHTTLGRNPLDEWSARRRDLYLTTHNNHKRQTSMSLAGLESAIPANERPQTHTLDRATTGISASIYLVQW